MIDTVTFRIAPQSGSHVRRFDLFTPEFKQRRVQDLSKIELAKGRTKPYIQKFILKGSQKEHGYIPKVEIWEKLNEVGVVYEMRLEVSLPKLLFGNNLQELKENDFSKVIRKIQSSLERVSIHVTYDAIINARVSYVHLGKNLLLPKNIHPSEIIRTMAKVKTTKAYSNVSERFDNDGALTRLTCGRKEDVFYDKVKDLLKTKSKALDKQGRDTETQIIEEYNLWGAHILRYEYRMKHNNIVKSTINTYLGRNYHTPILLKDLFNQGLWKNTLLTQWNNIYIQPENQTLFKTFDIEEEVISEQLINTAFKDDPSIGGYNKALVSWALALSISIYGANRTREKCLGKYSEETCGKRLRKKMQKAEKLLREMPVSNAMSFTNIKMQEFEQITLASLTEYSKI